MARLSISNTRGDTDNQPNAPFTGNLNLLPGALRSADANFTELYGGSSGTAGLVVNINTQATAPSTQAGFWDAALAAAITAIGVIGTANGGTIQFGPGTYAFANAFPTPANNGDGVWTSNPIQLRGASAQGFGPQNTGTGTPDPIGGTVLDFQCTATYGKIALANNMLLSIRDLTLTATANSTTPILYVTNPSLDLYNVCFWGRSGTGKTCAQDAIILGGTTTTVFGHALTDGFQGYSTIIKGCHFHRIKRCVNLRTYVNSIKIRDNNVWVTCGSPTANDAAFYVDGSGGAGFCVGNQISGNLIEMTNYPYGIFLKSAFSNGLMGNSFFDGAGTYSLAAVGNDSVSQFNTIQNDYTCALAAPSGQMPILDDQAYYSVAATGVPTYVSGTSFTVTGNQTAAFYAGRRIRLPCTNKLILGLVTTSVFGASTTVTFTVEAGPSTGIDNTVSAVTLARNDQAPQNWVISGIQGQTSRINNFEVMDNSYVTKIPRLLINYSAGSDGFKIQPDATAGALGAGVLLMSAYKAASDGGTDLLHLAYDGKLYFGDAAAAGTFWINGTKWSTNGTGGNLLWDSGTGGSYGILKHFALKFQRYDTGAFMQNAANAADATMLWSTNGFVTENYVTTQTPIAIASLPAAATVGAGARYFVTDANATMTAGIGAIVANGGANKVPVYSDGTNWRIG